MKNFFAVLLVCLPMMAAAQSFEQEVRAWQHHYKQDFLSDTHSPLKAADTGFLRFYPPSKAMRVEAMVLPPRDSQAISIQTHAGTTKQLLPYAVLMFSAPGVPHGPMLMLVAYQIKSGDSLLFVPFNDLTNGKETYGGGRYIDLAKRDIRNRTVVIDFNKAYNPYCAFATGYACPIPPVENRMFVEITAGEMLPAPPLRQKED